MTVLVEPIRDIEHTVSDISLCLSCLVAKASVLPVQHTARQLALGLLDIEAKLDPKSRLSGMFITNPNSMDDGLQAIANSPVEPSQEDHLI
jgi:hypothetical protein